MLAIRLQRLGRKQYPVYRVAIQEAQRHPSSGRVVAYVGSYNPHTKKASFDKEKVEKYLSHGAQPSPRVIRLLDDQKITLPSWVKRASGKQERTIRHPEKLRKNQSLEETSVEPEAEETQNDTEKKPVETLEEESVEEKTKKTEVTDKEEK